MPEGHGVVLMVSLKKYVPCKCGANNSFEFNSDMSVEDITVSARCPACGASISVSVSALFTPVLPAAPPTEQTIPAQPEADTRANVEQAVRDLFR